MSIRHLPDGPCWLHVVGPDGPEVLLATYDSRTNSVTLVDDGGSQHPVEGNRVHKWTVFAATPVERPTPVGSGYKMAASSHEGLPDSRPVCRDHEGRWVEEATGLRVPDEVKVYADAWFRRLLIST